jgi:quercetin dioxygenase-like cupin family protein
MGWHSHPGPGFVQVTSGTVSFYEAGDLSCTPTVVGVGQVWLDRGEAAHIARNETGSPATFLVTLFTPPGTMARIDEPAPGNCPF